MRSAVAAFLMLACISLADGPPIADLSDGNIFQVVLPDEDVHIQYVERDHFTVRLETATAAVDGRKLYIGDCKVALELAATPFDGILFQGTKIDHSRRHELFKKGSTIKVKSGYKKATELPPGSVYVVMPGVKYEMPDEP